MKDILLFVIAICVGLFLTAGYVTFIKKSPVFPVPNLQTIFRASNFSLEKAPGESLVGKITKMSGDVLWQSRVATDSSKLTSLIDIQQGENLTTNKESSAVVVFDKNLEIDIGEKSAVEFVQTLPVNIVLVQGSGVVEYKKLGGFPVSIRALHLLIENGGDVKVSLDDKKPIATVAVVSGSVTFSYNNTDNVTSVTTIAAGKKLIFNDDTRRALVE